MPLPIFSARLLDLMQFNNLSKHKLAADIGVQRKSIINWVEGRNYPRYDALIKLANHFKVSTDYLVGLTDNNTQYNHVNSYKVQNNGTSECGRGYWYFCPPKYKSYRKIEISDNREHRYDYQCL